MSDSEEPRHDADYCHWDNLRQQYGMTCAAHGCNFVARGDTWAEVGEEMDEHIEENRRPT